MDIRFEHGFSLAETLDMVYNDELDGDIYIEPPEPNVDTDEDSADEDDGGLVDNLTSRQLRAPAKIRLYNNERLGSQYDAVENANIADQETNLVPAPVLVPEHAAWFEDRRTQSKSFVPQWEKGADYAVVPQKYFPPPDYSRQQTTQNKRRRCALKTCNSTVRTMCSKCNVALCITCFAPYHSR